MKANEILTRLEYGTGEFDSEAVGEAICRPAEIAPALLQILEDTVADNESLPEQYTGHLYAIHILAELRETEAHMLLLQLCLLPERRLNALLGNVLDGGLDRALAATADGDTSGIALLIEDAEACLDARISGLRALVQLAESGDVSRGTIIQCLAGLFGGLEPNPSLLWEELVSCARQLAAFELKRYVRSVWKAGLIEGDLAEINRRLGRPWKKSRIVPGGAPADTPEIFADSWWNRYRAA